MGSKRQFTAMVNNLMNLSTDGNPIKKTGTTTVAKIKTDTGTAVFTGTKNCYIMFNITFPTIPLVTITPTLESNNPLYKAVVTTTGMTIKCQSSWTGEFDWEARERP